MARRKNAPDPSKIASISSYVSENTAEDVDARPSRSRRGLTREETSQVCFRIEKERHKKLRVLAVDQDMEIGEILDNLIRDHLKI